MDDQIRILILEDNASDAELMQRELRKAGFNFAASVVQSEAAFVQALDEFRPDLVLADFSLPGFHGMAALELARERRTEMPVIIVSGTIGEETAIEAMKAGATDYVLKDRLNRLSLAVERALQEAKQRREYRQVEYERELTVELLKIINERSSLVDLLRAATNFFQNRSGCEAVGVRFRDDGDFPYFEQCGFPEDFVLAENSLCMRDSSGQVLRDDVGKPVLECICGSVILGKFDASKPFFTAGGSFWTNSTSELLAGTPEDDLGRTRNRCNHEGYESVALVPLRVGETRLGLLQLNDRRRDMFTPAAIAMWERLGAHLAVAVAKLSAEEAVRNHAGLLQRALLPSVPPNVAGYSVASSYMPGRAGAEIGGDFYDVFRTEDGSIGFLIGDVTGKGIEAASLAAATRNTVRAFSYGSSSPAVSLSRANSVLIRNGLTKDRFVTVFVAVLDPKTGEISYASAGHPPAVVCDTAEGASILSVGSLPLGIQESCDYVEDKAYLKPGGKIILYTDGVTESRRGDHFYGEKRLIEVLDQNSHLPAHSLLECISDSLYKWSSGRVDDDTAILIAGREMPDGKSS